VRGVEKLGLERRSMSDVLAENYIPFFVLSSK